MVLCNFSGTRPPSEEESMGGSYGNRGAKDSHCLDHMCGILQNKGRSTWEKKLPHQSACLAVLTLSMVSKMAPAAPAAVNRLSILGAALPRENAPISTAKNTWTHTHTHTHTHLDRDNSCNNCSLSLFQRVPVRGVSVAAVRTKFSPPPSPPTFPQSQWLC